MAEILNKCKTKDFLTIDEIDVFSSDIKNRTSYDIERLKDSIKKNGFLFPLFIWNGHNVILDGKARYIALKQLSKEGYILSKIPVVIIEAKNEEEAKEKVLQVNSRYGKITEASLDYFSKDFDINLSELNIHLDKINFKFDTKSSLISKGVDAVNNHLSDIGNNDIQECVQDCSSLKIEGTQQPSEDIFCGNNGNIEQDWADSQHDYVEAPQFDDCCSVDSFIDSTYNKGFVEENCIEVDNHQKFDNSVSFTCPFCYSSFDLTMEEVKRILEI